MLRVDEWTDVDRKRGTVTAGCMHQSNPMCTPGAHRAWTPEAVPAAFSQCHKWTITLTWSLNALLTGNGWKIRLYLKIIWPQKSAGNLTKPYKWIKIFYPGGLACKNGICVSSPLSSCKHVIVLALCRLFFCLNAGIFGIFHFSKVLSNSLLRVWTGELQGWSKAFPSPSCFTHLCWWSHLAEWWSPRSSCPHPSQAHPNESLESQVFAPWAWAELAGSFWAVPF